MGNQIEFRQLRSFKVLAEELHFRRAAEKLFISQPGLSKQIRQLETILGVQLLDRDRRNVRLTNCGKYLQNQLGYLDGFLDRTISQLKNIAAGMEGEVRIGFVGSAMQNVIPSLIKKSNNLYPDIHFILDEMSNQAQVEALQHNLIDIGFVRLGEVPMNLEIKPIFEDHFSLVVPKDYPIKQANFKNISQFETEGFILFSSDYSSTYYKKIMSIFSDAGFSPKVAHKSIHANSIFRLVELGLGVAIVPHALTIGATLGIDIQVIELKNIPQRALLSGVWKKDTFDPVLRKVLAFLK